MGVNSKKDFIKQRSDKKIKRLNYLLRASLIYMSIVVLYDSIIHNTPLYYIGFYFLGLMSGRIYRRLLIVEHKETTHEITLKTNKWDIVLIILLALFRFSYGMKMLEYIHVIWAADALYLFFIGLYRSKWKGIVKQIDEIVYRWASNKSEAQKM